MQGRRPTPPAWSECRQGGWRMRSPAGWRTGWRSHGQRHRHWARHLERGSFWPGTKHPTPMPRRPMFRPPRGIRRDRRPPRPEPDARSPAPRFGRPRCGRPTRGRWRRRKRSSAPSFLRPIDAPDSENTRTDDQTAPLTDSPADGPNSSRCDKIAELPCVHSRGSDGNVKTHSPIPPCGPMHAADARRPSRPTPG